jgi:hypothetical protein
MEPTADGGARVLWVEGRPEQTRTVTIGAALLSADGRVTAQARAFLPIEAPYDWFAWNGSRFLLFAASVSSVRTTLLEPNTLAHGGGVEIFKSECFRYPVSIVTVGDGFLVLVERGYDPSCGNAESRRSHLVRLDARGVATSSRATGAPLEGAGCTSRLAPHDGDLLEVTGRVSNTTGVTCTAVIDSALGAVAGPIDLKDLAYDLRGNLIPVFPAAGWTSDASSVAIAYAQNAPSPGDMFLVRDNAQGSAISGPVHISNGRALAVGGGADFTGVVFLSYRPIDQDAISPYPADQSFNDVYVAVLDEDGKKLGGDILMMQSQFALPQVLVTAKSARTLSVFVREGQGVVRSEVSCGP